MGMTDGKGRQKGVRELPTRDKKKLRYSMPSMGFFTGQVCSQVSWAFLTSCKLGGRGVLPVVQEYQVKEYLIRLDLGDDIRQSSSKGTLYRL